MVGIIIAVVATAVCGILATVVVARRVQAQAALDAQLTNAWKSSNPDDKRQALDAWHDARKASPGVFWYWAGSATGAVVLLAMSFVSGRDAADKALDQQKRDIAALLEEGHRTILLQAEAGRQQSQEIASAANESLRKLGEIRARLEDSVLGHRLERALVVLMEGAKKPDKPNKGTN